MRDWRPARTGGATCPTIGGAGTSTRRRRSVGRRHGAVGAVVLAATAVVATTLSAGSTVGTASGPDRHPTARTVRLDSTSTPPTYTWSRLGHDPANTGVSADPAITNANAGTLGVRWMSGTGGAIVSSPVVAWSAGLGRTLVLVANNAGYLTAFDQSTGAVVWSDAMGSEIVSTPLVDGNYLWMTTRYSPALQKVDLATGARLCSAPLASIAEGSPTIGTPTGGRSSVYIGVDDLGATSGPVYSIDEATCGLNWKSTAYASPTGSWDPLSFANDANGRSLVLFGTSDPDNSIYALDARTGVVAWSFKFPPQPGTNEPDIDCGAGVAVSAPGTNGFADGVAYVPDEDGSLFAFDLTTGATVWTTYFGTGLPSYHVARATPALVDGNVVFGESSGVMAYNEVTGAPAWTFNTGNVESISVPAGVGPAGQQVVAVTTVAGAFDVLDAATGALLYTYQSPSYTVSSMADVDGNLIVTSADGFVYDLAPGGGNGPAPTTAVTSPANGKTVVNPLGSLTVSGSATGVQVAGVQVAVQSGGPGGPWWNGTTGTWTPGFAFGGATLASPGASSSTWTFAFPVPPGGGSYRVLASAFQSNGIADVTEFTPAPGAASSSVTVRNAPGTPAVTAVSPWVAPGAVVQLGGSGFLAGEPVTASLGGVVLATKAATSTGALHALRVPIPATAAFGTAALTVTGQTSGRTTSASIDIANSWSGAGDDPGHTSFEPNDPVLLQTVAPGPPAFLDAVWSDPFGATVRTSPAVAKDVAYFGDSAGGVHAVNVRNGQSLWSVTESGGVDSSPAIDGTLVVFGTGNGSVTAVNQANGATTWSTPTSSAVASSPAVSNGSVYVGSADGTVYDLNATTGAVVWSTKMAGAVTDSPSVDPTAGVVVVGDSSGTVTGLSASTGSVLWTHVTGGPVTASASIYRGTAYIGSADGTVYAFADATGRVVWSVVTTGAVTAGGAIYQEAGTAQYYAAGSQDGTMRLFALATGTVAVVKNVGGPVVGLATSQGWMVVTCSNGQLWGLKRNAEAIWKMAAPAPFATSAAIVDGVVYVGGDSQTFTAYTVPGRAIP